MLVNSKKKSSFGPVLRKLFCFEEYPNIVASHCTYTYLGNRKINCVIDTKLASVRLVFAKLAKL